MIVVTPQIKEKEKAKEKVKEKEKGTSVSHMKL